MDLNKLQKIVERGVWRKRPDILQRIFDKYCELSKGQTTLTHFGTPDFWNAIFGGELTGMRL
jgi:hypothetical protein